MVRNPCAACNGSGQELRVVNPNWPKGDKPYCEYTGEDCPECKGTGKAKDSQDTRRIALCRGARGCGKFKRINEATGLCDECAPPEFFYTTDHPHDGFRGETTWTADEDNHYEPILSLERAQELAEAKARSKFGDANYVRTTYGVRYKVN